MSKSDTAWYEEDLPLYTHTSVLGVNIGDHQRTGDTTDIKVYPHHHCWGPGVYRELCDWIRRNKCHIPREDTSDG